MTGTLGAARALSPRVRASLVVSNSGSNAVISWTDAAGPFNVYRGTRTASAWAYNASCLDHGTSGSTEDAALPDPGVAAWYLVSRTSSCGESALGVDSGGAPLPNASLRALEPSRRKQGSGPV